MNINNLINIPKVKYLLAFLYGCMPLVFFYQYFTYYADHFFLQYQLFNDMNWYKYWFNLADFLTFPTGFIVALFFGTPKGYIENLFQECLTLYIIGSIQYPIWFMFSWLNCKRKPIMFSFTLCFCLIFILFWPSHSNFLEYKSHLTKLMIEKNLNLEGQRNLNDTLIKAGKLSTEQSNYLFSDEYQNNITIEEKNKWLILDFENNLHVSFMGYGGVDIYAKLLNLPIIYLHNNSFNGIKYNLNLNDDEVLYRAYYFYRKDTEPDIKDNSVATIAQSICDKNKIYSYISSVGEQLCSWHKKNYPLLINNYNINTTNFFIIKNYALMGDKNLSYQVQEYYKQNQDHRNYVKWLLISSENDNRISQEELGILLSNNITEEDLLILHLSKNEKDNRGNFWLDMSKKSQ